MKILLAIFLPLMIAGCATPQDDLPASSDAGLNPAPIGATAAGTDVNPAPVTAIPAGTDVNLRSVLEGCSIVAEDGKMLGVITSNIYDEKSIFNEYGDYGGKYGSTSIWNEYGDYGGRYSSMSPFNPYTDTPPRIISPRGDIVGFLTVNRFKTPGINPYAVVAAMK